MHRFSGLEGCYVAILYCFRLDAGGDFGGPIEEKVSDLEVWKTWKAWNRSKLYRELEVIELDNHLD